MDLCNHLIPAIKLSLAETFKIKVKIETGHPEYSYLYQLSTSKVICISYLLQTCASVLFHLVKIGYLSLFMLCPAER